jgi:glycosyltransferase involved in cell wall biosynthesis
MRMVWSGASRRGMRQALDEFQPDIVHCHNVYHQLSPSILRAVHAANVPCVMTLHDYKLVCPSYQMLDNGRLCDACVTGGPLQALRHSCKDGSRSSSAFLGVESAVHRWLGAYNPVDRFISPSHFLARQMSRAGVFPDRVSVVPNFADVDRTLVAERPGQGVVFAGRLSHEKGLDILIRAVGKLGPLTRLHVAGDGPSRGRLQALADEVAAGQVTFHGRLSRPALAELVRSCAVCAVPSRWHENQPMTILEAFASGVPVVTTTLGGLPELVRDGVDGALVPPEDPEALAAALAALLAHPGRTHEMGKQARRRAEGEFSAQAHLKNLAAVYAMALADQRRQRAGTVRA